MYHVPPSHIRDPRLRWAIALAVVLCSLGAGFLAHFLSNGYQGQEGAVFAIVAYFVLMFVCEYASDRLWLRGLYGLALIGLLLSLISIAILHGYLFPSAPRMDWDWSEWHNLSAPGVALLIAPLHIRRLWARAERRAEAELSAEDEED